MPLTEYVKALGDGIRSRSVFPEPVRVRVGSRLRDWIESEQIKRLHRAVLHRGNPQRTHLPVWFRDVQSPKRESLIASLLQVVYRCFFLHRSVPHDAVHSRGSFTRVFSHLLNGDGFAAKRAGKKMLQGFHFAPPLILYSLHDTRLEPSHDALCRRPVNDLPVNHKAGERTSLNYSCHLLSLLRQLLKFSRDWRPDGSLHAFA